METGVRVLDAMTKQPVTISPFATVLDAAKLMEREGVGSLVVLRGKELVGLVTERHLIQHVIAKNRSTDTKVETIMNGQVLSLKPSIDIYDALLMMNQFDIRHAPVVHNSELVGFITQKDIMKIQPDLIEVASRNFQLREEEYKPVMQTRQSGVHFYFD